ncbi:MAG TPA: hypothetical protein VLK27_11480 [Chthoniobacterales bacterium]|nr:hypothetical protein [Chthoniobacterales bacterium]
MRKIFLPICLSISLVPALFAADEKAAPASKTKPPESSAPADAKNKPADEPVPITLKNKSSFQFDAGSRSPFWPIGWKPTARIATGGTDQGAVPPGAFLVTSITLDGATHFAIINGKTMGEGQPFGLQIGTQIYQVTVKRIEDGRVILDSHGAEIVVPLRRKEAAEKLLDGASRSPSEKR